MQALDYSIIIVYLVILLILGFWRRISPSGNSAELILGGRLLTLPAFVASLVSTWYGGILGVGEYSYRYGLSNWIVFGLPYYLAAFIFAIFLARKARESRVTTIPEKLAQVYGEKTALAGSFIIYFMTVPAAYILMLGVLGEKLFGWPLWIGILAGAIFSVIYVFSGAFKSVVRTDVLQFGLMFLGFAVLLVILISKYGGYEYLANNLPASHLTLDGGNTHWYIASWYVIALATLIEPAFFQRCYAAKNASVARKGIFISIACWAVFDFMTTSCGLYARAVLPNLADPVASYPALAMQVLPVGLLGLFALTLLATVMSTVDSYSFLAASTFGNDIVPRITKDSKHSVTFYTRIGLFISIMLAVVLALFFKSVVDIWHIFGSIGTPALLLPVFLSFVSKRKMPRGYALSSILICGPVSLIWYLSKYIKADENYIWGFEPIFPGLVLSIIIFVIFLYLPKRKPAE